MAVTYTNKAANNNSKFYINMGWDFTPNSPSISDFTATNDRTSITVAATIAAPTTGSFKIYNIRGGRTDTYTSYETSACNVKETVISTSNTRQKCSVYFNKKSDGPHAWSNVARTFTGIATGTGKYVNIAVTKSSVTSVNGKYFNYKYNFGTTQSQEYSMDNSTWQSSGTFDNLTPNTTYTFYVRSRATSYTSNHSDYVYETVEGRTTGDPEPKIWMKVNGSWVQGTPYIKNNGDWIVAKEVYVKSGGVWNKGTN